MFKKRDPVCGVRVSKKTPYTFKCGNKIYYFDSQACRDTFKERSECFVQRKSGRGLLAWLASGSRNVPKSCHDMKSQKEG